MKNERIFGAVGSLLLHALLLIAFIPQEQPEQEQRKPVPVNRLGDNGYLRVIIEGDEDHDGKIDKSGLAKDTCKGTEYTGIGISITLFGTVIQVAKGSPAERAGILVGDVIPAGLDFDSSKSGTVEVHIERGAQELTLTIKTKSICKEDS